MGRRDLKQGETRDRDSRNSHCRGPRFVTTRPQIQVTVLGIEVKKHCPWFVSLRKERVNI